MENLIKNKNLEQLLIKHWTEFLDYRKLIAFVLQSVRDTNFPVYEENNLPKKGIEINITYISLLSTGFCLWIDFTVPQENAFAIGTCECFLSLDGELKLNKTIGQILKSHSE